MPVRRPDLHSVLCSNSLNVGTIFSAVVSSNTGAVSNNFVADSKDSSAVPPVLEVQEEGPSRSRRQNVLFLLPPGR